MPSGLKVDMTAEASPKLLDQIRKLTKINAVLMDRIERSVDRQGNGFTLFQTAIALEAQVRARTEELTHVLRSLECTNAQLSAAKEDAEKANLSKTRFLAAASHDLLQPVVSAKLTISTLAELQENPEGKRLAQQVEGSLQTIEDLIRNSPRHLEARRRCHRPGSAVFLSRRFAGRPPFHIRECDGFERNQAQNPPLRPDR